jgi:Domain of unknown function (DUF222)/HNH endonuclease
MDSNTHSTGQATARSGGQAAAEPSGRPGQELLGEPVAGSVGVPAGLGRQPVAEPAGRPMAGHPGQPVGQPTDASDQVPAGLAWLAAAVDQLAAQDPAGLPDAVAAERVLVLRTLLDRLDGQWLRELAAVDARGAAGAERGTPAASTAAWLRARARLTAGAARQHVQVARALYRGPLPQTAAALAAGELSGGHAVVLAQGTSDLDPTTTVAAEPVLLDAARRLDPAGLRRVVTHLRVVADPDREDQQAQRRFEQRGLQVAGTWQGMVALHGLLDPEAGETLLAALDPLTRPTGAEDPRTAAQRRADALTELARQALASGRLPDSGGLRPQVTVTVDLAALGDRSGVPGVLGWVGPVGAETARRLACDAALTRVVTTHPTSASHDPVGDGHHDPDGGHDPASAGPHDPAPAGHDPPASTHQPAPSSHGHDPATGTPEPLATGHGHDPVPGHHDTLVGRLRQGLALLPPALGGAPSQILDVGRTTRVVPAGLRTALAVRDRGCVVAGCDRPPAWCDAHHLRHWVHGGPTSLDNLVLVCRAHHRAVHEGHQHLAPAPTGHTLSHHPHHNPPPPDTPTALREPCVVADQGDVVVVGG